MMDVNTMTDEEVMQMLKESEQLQKEGYEAAVAARARQELQVDAWAKAIAKAPAEVLEELQLPEELTLRAMIPELYKPFDEFDEAVYQEQYNKAKELEERYYKLAMRYNREQLALRKEVEALNQKA